MHPAYLLAGPTAIGKTALAHVIARREQWPILSADAMLVYRGMDVGTAKPTPADRQGIPAYGGLDVVTPDQRFSVGAYLDAARTFLATLPPDQPVLVVGGTGLYLKALLLGLDPMPVVDPAVRVWAEQHYAETGLAGIRQACRELDPQRYAAIEDTDNPRRLLRALELARMGVPFSGVWSADRPQGTITLLQMARASLNQRIEQRVHRMWVDGLLDEVRGLEQAYPVWSDTAAKAIGYGEARSALQGESTEAEAQQETIRRTCKLARKQVTWFRHQWPSHLIECAGRTLNDLAETVQTHWRANGPCFISG